MWSFIYTSAYFRHSDVEIRHKEYDFTFRFSLILYSEGPKCSINNVFFCVQSVLLYLQ